MPEPKDNSRIEKLERSLYRREATDNTPEKRSEIPRSQFKVAGGWPDDPVKTDQSSFTESPDKNPSNFFKKLLFGALGFFVASIVVALFIFFGGFNSISTKNVDIGVLGPVSVAGSEELSLDILVRNNNNALMESADLIVEYPAGTRMADDAAVELTRYRENLGDINSGAEVTRTVKSRLFGEKGEVKEINIMVEYGVKNSNATFLKEKKYEVVIGTSPVVMTIDYPQEINANKEVTFTVNLASNSNTNIENLLLAAEYPFGFRFTNSDPQPVDDNNVWAIGVLKPEEKRTINIRGTIEGQNDEERSFRFYTGIRDPKDENQIGTQFTALLKSITIKKPFIGLNLSLNNSNADELISRLGSAVQGSVSFANNLPTQLSNASVEVKINGVALNKSSVSAASGGFYRSIDNTIVWDHNTNSALKEINPGSNNSLTFSFSTIANNSFFSNSSNKELQLEVTMRGSQSGSEGTPIEVVSTVSKKVRVSSDLGITARALYYSGPFSNSGPMPPRAEEDTTYTIVLTANNSFNNISNAVARVKLPPYIEWLGVTSPSSQTVAFNSLDREVVWTIGDLPAATSGTTVKEIAFQIKFTPSVGQINQSPNLVENISINGQDTFTGTTLQATRQPLTTRLSSDPQSTEGDSKVLP